MRPEENSISFKKLFIRISPVDVFLIFTGTIASALMGFLQPLVFYLIAVIIGEMTPDQTPEDFYDNALETCRFMIFLGCSLIISGFFAVLCWVKVGARQSYRYKVEYMKKLLQLETEWFEQAEVSELSTTAINDFIKVERATGDKIVFIVFTFTMFVTALAFNFLSNIRLSLIVLPLGFLIALGFYFANKGLHQSSTITPIAYKEASGIAEEALQEIKTVSALNAQKPIAYKFSKLLSKSKKSMITIGIKIGGGIGFACFMWGILTSVVFLVGAIELENESEDWITGNQITLTDVLIIQMCTAYAFNNIATLIPSLQALNQGKQAALRILKVLNHPTPTKGECMKQIEGHVCFENVSFSYPSFPDNLALKNVSFQLYPAERLGIAGTTGAGKTTIVDLLLSFFRPSTGSILIDNVPISYFDPKYLSKNIAYVSQEPLLFNTTIKNNILFGDLKADFDRVQKAAKYAEAYDFIEDLPDKWESVVGKKGSQLSGGQKQRIAIARSILRSPRILILDESTSALDRNTEFNVLSNLDKALGDCTRISIAQNLFTIRDSTNIIFLSEGRITEEGSHEELMEKHGSYYNLVKMQQQSMNNQIQDDLASKDACDSNNADIKAIEKDKARTYIKEVLRLNKSDKALIAAALLGCIAIGVTFPFAGMTNGLLISNLATKQGDELIDNTIEKAVWMIVFSVLMFSGEIFQFLSIPRLSANITTTMRESSLRAMLNFDADFFDNSSNNPTVLSSRLSKDCEDINAIGQSMIGLIVGNIVIIFTTFSLAAYFSWKISVVSLSMLPILLFFMMSVFLAQMKGIVSFSYEESGEFEEIASADYKSTNLKAIVAGLTYGAGFGVFVFVDALIYWYGAKLYRDEQINFEEMIVSIYVVLVGINGFVLAGVHSGDIGAALKAAKNIFRVLRHNPSIDVSNKAGVFRNLKGEIEFRQVWFSYSSRDSYALKDVSFRVEAGSKCAIIGNTGSGKSTVAQTLIRLYDPSSGAIFIDSIDIKTFQLKHLRKQIGVVSQEPVLFSGSILSNIALGTNHTKQDIQKAADEAEATEFIENHKKELDREVGFKGSKLSGGQKQRVAIARCIVRRPRIVVLDEATSALDSKTERCVLESLFESLKDSTFVIIAHRLKTIESANQIIVLDSGRILERGSKEQLLEDKGYFYNLINSLD